MPNQTPERYVPEPRIVDDPETLAYRYCVDNQTIREIAADADVSRTTVHNAIQEYGIGQTDDQQTDDERGHDPPWVHVDTEEYHANG